MFSAMHRPPCYCAGVEGKAKKMAGKKRPADRNTIKGRLAVDYLYLTTYEKSIADAWAESLGNLNGEAGKGAVWGIYAGYAWEEGSIKWGEGRQKGERHFCVIASSHWADRLAREIWDCESYNAKTCNVARLDVQITLPKRPPPCRWSQLAADYHDGLCGEFKGRSRPQVEARHSWDGETLYVGAASSDQRYRVYDKPVRVGSRREIWERTELQLRNKRAKALWGKMVASRSEFDRGAAAAVVRGHLDKWPPGFQARLASWEFLAKTEAAPLVIEKVEQEEGARLKWLKSLRRAMLDLCMEAGKPGEEARALLACTIVRALLLDDGADFRGWAMLSPDGEIHAVTPALPPAGLSHGASRL